MKKIISLILLCTILISCQKEEISEMENEQQISNQELVINKQVIRKIESLNFNSNDLKIVTHINSQGMSEQVYLVEGDIMISPDQLNSMSASDITTKQYRTHNLVSNNRTINIFGYSSGGYALTSKQQGALIQAVDNYNSLNIGLDFNLSFGPAPSSQDIIVKQVSGSAGGSAGFPSNENPYNSITIYSGTESYNSAVNEHILTHEIGHTIGMRHTDWFSRQSCGQSIDEGQTSHGAVHIPNTPTGYDANSLMLACFSASESGNFGANDVTALSYLYPAPAPFTAGISGPAKANNSGTYTWTATTSGGTAPYTYEWTRTSPTGSVYPWGGGMSSVTTNMPYNQDLELNLVVTDALGNSDTAWHYTMNESLNKPTR